MSQLSGLRVGATLQGDGVNNAAPRQCKTGEQAVSQTHGKYYEATHRQNVYSATNGATGALSGTALGTSPPILLYNPVGSGRRLKIMKVSAGYISGTLGAGTLFHCGFTINGPVGSQSNVAPAVGSGAVITPVNMDLGGANNSVAVAFALGTLNANPVPLYPLATLNAMLATTATNPSEIWEDVDGNIVLEPGAGWCLEAVAAAGTSPLISAAVIWEEVPII